MSAEILRTAAALMRQRAEAATSSPWAHWHMLDDDGCLEVFVPNGTMSTETVLEFKDHMDCEECVRPTAEDAEHIASWHPAVALAVADWLDALAAHVVHGNEPPLHAVAVACAYLGRDQ